MALTREQMGSLSTEIRRVRGRCLQRGKAFDRWLEKNPSVDVHEAMRFAAAIGDSPFPPIHAPHPVDRNIPFRDARFDGEWKNDE